jgi:hypothetical protein
MFDTKTDDFCFYDETLAIAPEAISLVIAFICHGYGTIERAKKVKKVMTRGTSTVKWCQ